MLTHATCRRISAMTYPPTLIVSIWGFESNFGRFTGVRPTVAASRRWRGTRDGPRSSAASCSTHWRSSIAAISTSRP
jgi:membrane-bound lytic murein transglycosylase B